MLRSDQTKRPMPLKRATTQDYYNIYENSLSNILGINRFSEMEQNLSPYHNSKISQI